jgi:hypothetical protein
MRIAIAVKSVTLKNADGNPLDGVRNRASLCICRRHYPNFFVAALVKPEIKHSSGDAVQYAGRSQND